MNTNLDALIALIESQPDAEHWLYFDEPDGGWRVTNEWLCGVFAGCGFSGKTRHDAVRQLADYFDRHIGHKSIVGRCVTESGWPDMARVRVYLAKQKEDDDDAQAA